MRVVTILLLSVAFLSGPAYAQSSGSAASGTAAPQPNNCGTPDQPKACPGTKGASTHTSTHKAVHKAAPKPQQPKSS